MSHESPLRQVVFPFALALALVLVGGVSRWWRLRPTARYNLQRQLAAWLRDYAFPDETVAAQDSRLLRQLSPLSTRTLPAGSPAALLTDLQAVPPDYCIGDESSAWRTVRRHPWFRERYRPVHRLADPYDPVTPLTVYAYTPSPFDGGEIISGTLSFAAADGGRFSLTGYRLPSRRLVPGGLLPLTLYWQAETTLYAPPALTVLLVRAGDGRVRARHHLPPDLLASVVWRPGTRLVTRHRPVLPDDLPAGEYGLQLLIAPLLQGGPVTLTVLSRPPDVGDVPQSPDRPLPTPVVFGASIELLGYDAPERAGPGDDLTVALYWHARAPLTVNYKVFVHLLAPGGDLLTQEDGLPVHWTYPTTRWRPGDYIRDGHRLTLPADAPRGDYLLAVGLYDAATGERLPVREGGAELPDRRLPLMTVRVR